MSTSLHHKGQRIVSPVTLGNIVAGETYTITAINRISGLFYLVLSQEGKVAGAIEERKILQS